MAREFVVNAQDPDSLGVTLVRDRVFSGRPLDRDHAIAVYEAHNAAVLAGIPADRLIVHNLGDGWAPLCDRLGVAIPDQPYPRRNATGEVRANLDRALAAARAAEGRPDPAAEV